MQEERTRSENLSDIQRQEHLRQITELNLKNNLLTTYTKTESDSITALKRIKQRQTILRLHGLRALLVMLIII